MSKKFNLFSLHSNTDLHPRTWICIRGKNVGKLFNELKIEIIKNKKFCRYKLNKIISGNLKCSLSTIQETLRTERGFYPIPIILELLKFSKNKNKFLKEFKNNIEYLKVNSASAKPVKAVNRLNKNLAKVLGAFMADGSLSVQTIFADKNLEKLEKIRWELEKVKINYSAGNCPSRNQHYLSIHINSKNSKSLNKFLKNSNLLIQTHYNVELTDAYKDNVEMFAKWIKDEFDINPNRFERRKNAWRVCFSNKVLVRYMTTFFEVVPGPKCLIAFEPKIIRKADIKIRKKFATGALMFDGCVSKDNKILFTTVSKNFHNSIKQIWRKDNISFGESICSRKSGYHRNYQIAEFNLFTTVNNTKNKLLNYFEPNTQKWKLLRWLDGNLENPPVIKPGKYFSMEELMELIKKVKICDTNFIKNYFQSSFTTIRIYLKILANQQKIKLSSRPNDLSNYIDKNTTVLLRKRIHCFIFCRIKNKFKTYKNFAKFIEIDGTTLSAWKTRKNRIPVYILKEICKTLKINFNKIYKNIENTDREIVEII